jgi:hypothetical protein
MGPELPAPGVLFADDNALPVTLTAKSDVEVLVFPKSSVVRITTRSPEFLLSFLRDSGNRIVFLAGLLRAPRRWVDPTGRANGLHPLHGRAEDGGLRGVTRGVSRFAGRFTLSKPFLSGPSRSPLP